ncbi:hypothetical protein PC116_g31631 [Phytophthora cactorum]|nr:hypothetical protein PC116_g31631 [Phytophthora cactorum]
MTAATVARDQRLGRSHNPITLLNRQKVTRFRPGGQAAFDEMVKKVGALRLGGKGAGPQNEGEAPAS